MKFILPALFILSVPLTARAEGGIFDGQCDNLRTSMEQSYGKAVACMRKMKTPSCAYAAWCDKAKPCDKALKCFGKATKCGKVHDACFATKDARACAEEKTVCAACTALSDECGKCNPADSACESEALADPKCKDVVGDYVSMRKDWQTTCAP